MSDILICKKTKSPGYPNCYERETWDYFLIIKKFGYVEYHNPHTHITKTIISWPSKIKTVFMGGLCVDKVTNKLIRCNHRFIYLLKRPSNKMTSQQFQNLSGMQYNRFSIASWCRDSFKEYV